MRARNLKPGLFTNELLGQADAAFTVLFEGLWCRADREGRLEDRPLRLRAELMPYRPAFDIEAALTWLQYNGFIDRYIVDGVAIIQVITFAKHQRPHANEVPSVLPAKVSSASDQGSKPAPPRNGQGDKDFALIPDPPLSDPGYLNPNTGLTDSSLTALAPMVDVESSKYWNAIQKMYPKGNARQRWSDAKKHADKLVADGRASWEQLYRNVCAYANNCDLTQRKVMDVRNFFSENDEPWANTWVSSAISSPGLDALCKQKEPEERAPAETGLRDSNAHEQAGVPPNGHHAKGRRGNVSKAQAEKTAYLLEVIAAVHLGDAPSSDADAVVASFAHSRYGDVTAEDIRVLRLEHDAKHGATLQ